MQFDHEKLDVYRAAIALLRITRQVILRLPRGCANFKEQLDRASLSVVTNVGEGAGEFMPLEKARFYRIACRSATECAAILDACDALNLTDPARTAEARDLLVRIVSMLTVLSRRLNQLPR